MKKVLYLLLWAVVSLVSIVVALAWMGVRLGPWLAGLLDHLLLCPLGRWFIDSVAVLMDRIAARGGWRRMEPATPQEAPVLSERDVIMANLERQVRAPGAVGAPAHGEYDAVHVGLEAKALAEAAAALSRRDPLGRVYFCSRLAPFPFVGSGHGYMYRLWMTDPNPDRQGRFIAWGQATGNCQDLLEYMGGES